MKHIWIFFILMSFDVQAMTCSTFLGTTNLSFYSVETLMESKLLYSDYFSTQMQTALKEISAHGVSREQFKKILASNNLSDLKLIAKTVYVVMANSDFPSERAKRLYEGLPYEVLQGRIVEALLLNAKYREQVQVDNKGVKDRVRDSSDLVAFLGTRAALPTWFATSTLWLLTNNTEVLVGGSALTAVSFLTGLVAMYRSEKADAAARDFEADFATQVLQDLSEIEKEGRSARETPVLALAVKSAFDGAVVEQELKEHGFFNFF